LKSYKRRTKESQSQGKEETLSASYVLT